MILNNIEVEILSTMSLLDAYESRFPEDFMMENVIYCIHNEINGKNYIGQTVKVQNRFSKTYVGHFRDYDRFVSGELNDSRALYRAWKKYGLESFTVYIIDSGKDREELNEKEVYWIKTLHTCVKDPDCFGYNLTWGADDMSVNCRESIERSLETRRSLYGEAFANCHTPEAFAKGNKTKEERYGHGGFVNAFTPEANEKRRQTNMERYGTAHGPRMSEEALEAMINKKIEEYGDPMGICNTPENREKAKRSLTLTYAFQNLEKNFLLADKKRIKIINLEQYYSLVADTYSSITTADRHLGKIIEFLPELKSDSRWKEDYETVFNRSKEELEKDFEKLKELRRKENKRLRAERWRSSVNTDGVSIYKCFYIIEVILSESSDKIITWEQYKEAAIRHYSRPIEGKAHLNRLINLLPKLKRDSRWKEDYEKIFGALAEDDKLEIVHKNRSNYGNDT